MNISLVLFAGLVLMSPPAMAQVWRSPQDAAFLEDVRAWSYQQGLSIISDATESGQRFNDTLIRTGKSFCRLFDSGTNAEGLIQAIEVRTANNSEIRGQMYVVLDAALAHYCPEYASLFQPYYNDYSTSSQRSRHLGTGRLIAEPGSRINVRNWPSLEAPINRYGSPGDRVTIWEVRPVNGFNWYKVAFVGSNTTGWVRSDLIQLD